MMVVLFLLVFVSVVWFKGAVFLCWVLCVEYCAQSKYGALDYLLTMSWRVRATRAPLLVFLLALLF